MNHHSTVYRIYLLTIWHYLDSPEPTQPADEPQPDDEHGAGTWCFTLEDPHTGQRRSFRTMVALTAALHAEFPAQPPHAAP